MTFKGTEQKRKKKQPGLQEEKLSHINIQHVMSGDNDIKHEDVKRPEIEKGSIKKAQTLAICTHGGDDKHQEYKGAVGAEYLPRWASRLLLEITDIRIERVQDTSHDDAVAEGVHHFDIEARLRDQSLSVAQIVFSRHWDVVHPDNDWNSNPMVLVIEFEKVIVDEY